MFQSISPFHLMPIASQSHLRPPAAVSVQPVDVMRREEKMNKCPLNAKSTAFYRIALIVIAADGFFRWQPQPPSCDTIIVLFSFRVNRANRVVGCIHPLHTFA